MILFSLLLLAAQPVPTASGSAPTVAAPQHPELPADSEFKSWVTESGIVETKASGAKYPFVRGESEIDASCDDVKRVLTDFDSYGKFFGGIVRSAKVLAKDDTSARVHFVWAYPWPFHDRDSIVGYQLTKTLGGQGGWRLEWHDDAQSGDPKTGVRIPHVEGAAQMNVAGEKKCAVSYTYYGDLGIDLTKGMTEKILKTEPVKYFEAIRKGLKAD